MQDLFESVKSFIKDNSSARDQIRDDLEKLEAQVKKWRFYEWTFFNGRDSDDARRCIMTTNSPEDLLALDLLYGPASE